MTGLLVASSGRTSTAAAVAGAARGDRPTVPSAVVGTCLLVFTEIMFFGGLISAYLVLRSQGGTWPPPGQPRLPVLVTAVSTLLLLASAPAIARVPGALLRGDRGRAVQGLLAALLLGTTFLAIQGWEWARLLGFGLTTRSSLYGALFYTLVGAHGAHVAGGLIALAVVLRQARRGRYTATAHDAVLGMRVFWLFVVLVWPVLYALVYLW